MKIIWLCNLELPQISQLYNERNNVFGGWLSTTCDMLLQSDELFVLYYKKEERKGQLNNLCYQSFDERNAYSVMKEAVQKFKPDVIHIWGTEFWYSNTFVNVIKDNNCLSRCVISIQGLVSVYCDHYLEGLSEHDIKTRTIKDIIKRSSILKEQAQFYQRGVMEKDTLKIAQNVIGRTDWDRICTYMINPKLKYHFCNETLRSGFYGPEWNPRTMEKNRIFVSQCSYPIKGFHQLLKVLPLIIKKYPSTEVYTTGKDILHLSIKQKLMISSYEKVLLNMIYSNGLENHIHFLGKLSETEMIEQYLRANVFVCPSSIENSPNSVGEAMILGCPVIATNVGGTANMLKNGEEGLLYQSTEPLLMAYDILRVFDNPELAMDMSIKARKHALKTHDRMMNYKRLKEIYSELQK